MIQKVQEDNAKTELDILLHDLESKSEEERAQAERVIKQSGIEAIEPLLARLQQELSRQQKRQRFAAPFMFLPALGFIALTLYGQDKSVAVFAAIILLMAFMIGGAFLIERIARPSALQKQLTAQLMDIDDLRTIGLLIDLMHTPGSINNDQVKTLLTSLLPKLQASDASLLQASHRDQLHYVLKNYDHFALGPTYGADYILAILKALEQVGDARSLPYVERLAHPDPPRDVTGRSLFRLRESYNAFFRFVTGGKFQPVDRLLIQQAAEECLAFLQVRAEQEKVSTSLLRASCVPTSSPDVLLRPAASTHNPKDAKQLLRAGSSEQIDE